MGRVGTWGIQLGVGTPFFTCREFLADLFQSLTESRNVEFEAKAPHILNTASDVINKNEVCQIKCLNVTFQLLLPAGAQTGNVMQEILSVLTHWEKSESLPLRSV